MKKVSRKSYIHPNKIDEYLSGSYVVCKSGPDAGELVRLLTSMHEGKTTYKVRYLMNREGVVKEKCLMLKLSCYDDIYNFFEPWYPGCVWVDSKYGGALIKPSKQSYKKSFSSHGFMMCAVGFDPVSKGTVSISMGGKVFDSGSWGVCEGRSLDEAVDMLLEKHGGQSMITNVALSAKFALSKSLKKNDTIFVLYKDQLLGYLDDRMRINIHPKYHPHFRDELTSIGEVV